jgi:hypothetical protein
MNRIGRRTLALMAIWGIVAISLGGCQGSRTGAAPLGDRATNVG